MDNCIGVDIGYGYTKTYNSVGSRSFPTIVTSAVPISTFTDIEPVRVNGDSFLVGEDAAMEGKGLISTRTVEFVMSKAWLAVMGYALSVSNFYSDDGKIVLGIPPGIFNKELASNIIETIKKSSISYRGYNLSFDKATIKVIPQGAGIFFAYMAKNEGDFRKNIAVVDIGYYTIDMIFFSRGKYIEGATKSSPLGVSLVIDDIKRAFQRQHGFSIHEEGVNSLLKNNYVIVLDKMYTVNNLKSIIGSYAEQVSSSINEFFNTLPIKPEMGLIGGGGTLFLKGYVNLEYKLRIVIPPEFANAIGYWHYGKGR